ncbi:hypothetical protein C8J57DRAFT_1120522 [Mycena rebaudengoi]|nr:hypothetical protein C8J57DRAFT_1120522 [Mycena rebaudengoi]
MRAVEQQIDTNYREVARLQGVIANLQGAIMSLHRQCAELHDFANIHNGMISGMRRLPSELLSEIFLRYVRMETRFRGPWIIATVCCRWRAVALSSPLLWCHFLDIRRRTPVALLSKQLERSGNAPIYLNFRSRNFQTAADSSLNALDLFLAASTRWREVALELSFKDMSHLGAFAGAFPLLQTLAIMNRELEASLVEVFAVLPSLIELELHGIPTQITFPFTSLRRCIIKSCNSTNVLRTLSLLAPGAAFYVRHCYAPPNYLSPPTTSHVRILQIEQCDYFFIQDVLRALIAPALTDLTIGGSYGIDITPYIIQFLSNTHCSLNCLGLPRTQISADDFRRVLGLASDIVELEIQLSPGTQVALLQVLSATSESHIAVAPRLRRLVLRGEILDCVSIMRVLRSRAGVLEFVDLDVLLPDEDVEELHAHRIQMSYRGHIQEERTRKKEGRLRSSVT